MDNASRIPDERRAQEEADAAAAEAAGIGGERAEGDDGRDPAQQAVREGGGGESEGFEQAEQDLIENAGNGQVDSNLGGLTPEAESDRSSAVYGEADREGDPEEEPGEQ